MWSKGINICRQRQEKEGERKMKGGNLTVVNDFGH